MKISFKIDTFQAVTQMLEEYKISKFSSFNEFLDNMYPQTTIIPASRFGNAIIIIAKDEYKPKSLDVLLEEYNKSITPQPINQNTPGKTKKKRLIKQSIPSSTEVPSLLIPQNDKKSKPIVKHQSMECNRHKTRIDYKRNGIDCTQIA